MTDSHEMNFGDPETELAFRHACSIEIKPIQWLWPNRFARGKISMIAGEPGLGKSQVTISMAAHITNGRTWPDGSPCEQGDVIFLSAEDDPSDTQVPRLKAAEAELACTHIIDAVKSSCANGQETVNHFQLAKHLVALENTIREIGNVTTLFINPISPYMGTNVDDHKNTSVRSILTPLSKLAEKLNIAIIIVTHLNKNDSQKAVNRVIGSIGYIAACRAAFAVVRDKDNHDRRLFLPLKNNIGNDESGLAFTIENCDLDNDIKTSRVLWSSEVIAQKADQAMLPDGNEDERNARTDAKDFLENLLANGPLSANQIIQMAKNDGIAEKTLRRAQKDLGIRPDRKGFSSGGQSYWALPAKTTPILGQNSHTCPPKIVGKYDENDQVWPEEQGTYSVINRN